MGNPLWFLLGCLGTRLIAALIVKYLPKIYLPYAGILGLIVAISMFFIYIFNLRPTGMEAGGMTGRKGKIWWNNVRPIHAALYAIFAAYAFQKKSYAYLPLLADVFFGLSVWIHHYYY
jgi:hypothetical protein